MKKSCFLMFIMGVFLVGICGCAGTERNSAATGSGNKINTETEISYDVEGYKERLQQKRVPFTDYADQYADDVSAVIAAEYQLLHFDQAVFGEFPNTDKVSLLKANDRNITAEESIDIVKGWLKNIWKTDDVNLETELGVLNFNIDTSGDESVVETADGTKYPLVYPHITELMSGEGVFLDRDDCYIVIGDDGIGEMSDGKVSRYLNENGISARAADVLFMEQLGTEIVSGDTEELGEEVYPLINEELTIGEGADIAEKYFSQGTPYAWTEELQSRASEVTVYQVEDVYCYEFDMTRYYCGVPVVRTESGTYQFDGNYYVAGDSKKAYVADGESVTAYRGTNDGEPLIPLVTEEELLCLPDAVGILDENLASQLNVSVNLVEFVYLPLGFEDSSNTDEEIFFPCWRFEGFNSVKNETMELYVDALTGDVYYYTFSPENTGYHAE